MRFNPFACLVICFLNGLVLLAAVRPAVAQDAAVHPLEELRTLDSYFPFTPPRSLEEWTHRREALRRHVQVSLGLWPMPQKTPLDPVVHGKIDMGDYTIEKVYFESFPGFLVTGNLYRPANSTGRVPGVLCPHGHFRDGRFRWATDEELARDMESSGEQFESNGRSPLQARCANLAMMGCVVFHYDMPGYADSQQITHELAHGFRTQRPHMNAVDGWGFFSPQAELRMQSIMGLQTWNSIRSLDFLCSLPDVDASRIGVTGGSGGGTQTFILCAIDPRPAVAFPAVMVSTAMQGGCTCENCCNLRVGAGNVDFAALFAPKPLGLTAADDWTREMETKGFPELQSLYGLYINDFPDPAANRLQLTARLQFGHNYNQVSREAMYRFMNRHLDLGLNNDQLAEKPITVHQRDVLTVFDDEHPPPAWSDERERELLRTWQQLGAIAALQKETLYDDDWFQLQQSVTAALQALVAHPSCELDWQDSGGEIDKQPNQLDLEAGKLSAIDGQLVYPVAIATEPDFDLTRATNIIVDLKEGGIGETLADLANQDSDAARQRQRYGMVVGVDLLPTLQDEGHIAGNRLVNNGREAAGFTFGYNRPLFCWRVSQVLYLIEFLQQRYPGKRISLKADETMSPVAVVARALASPDLEINLWCDLNGFQFASVSNLRHPHFFPGAVKYGDIDAFLACRLGGSVGLFGKREATLPLTTQASAAGRCRLIVPSRLFSEDEEADR